MYIWKIEALVEDFKANRVTQREKMKYCLLSSVIALVVLHLPYEAHSPTLHTIEFLISVAITIGGILLCFKANQSGDDEEFIDRVICLGLPITIRLVVLFIPFFTLVSIVTTEITPVNSPIEPAAPTTETSDLYGPVIEIVLFAILQLVIYWRLRYQILRVSSTTPESQQTS